MLPTLYYIPDTLWGLPVFGGGLLLAVWILFSLIWLAWLLRRQGFNADTQSQLPLLLVVAAAIYWILPNLSEPGRGLPVRGYGVMMLLGVVSGAWLAIRRARPLGMTSDEVMTLVFWLVLPGIVGARAFYVTEYWADFLRHAPDGGVDVTRTLFAVLNIAQGGLVVYGSFLGASVGLLGYAATHRLSPLALADLLAPSMMLGLAFGRLGCMMNGCCFGGACDHAWAVTFPFASPPHVRQVERGQLFLHGLKLAPQPAAPPVIEEVQAGSAAAKAGLAAGQRIQSINGYAVASADDARALLLHVQEPGQEIAVAVQGDAAVHRWTLDATPPRSLPVHPTQLYGAINGFLLMLLLLAYAPFRRRDGALFALMITVYPIARFLQESIRTDEPLIFGTGMTISQNVSVAIFAAAMGLWVYLLRRAPGVSRLSTQH